MKKNVYLATLVLLPSVAVSSAYALNPSREKDVEFLSTPVSLIQAVTTAEKQLDGKAMSAELGHKEGKLIYEIEIVAPDKTVDVEIDATSGLVLSSKQDTEVEGDEENNDCNCDEKDDD